MNRFRALLSAVFASVLSLGMWVFASSTFFPVCSVDYEAGSQLFKDRCSSCHSLDTTSIPYGPSLNGIARVAASRVPNMSAERYLVESIVTPAAFRSDEFAGVMPGDIAADLSTTEVASLVGYLMETERRVDPIRVSRIVRELNPPRSSTKSLPSLSELEAGRALFLGKGKCVDCHSLRKTAGAKLTAPSLLDAGRHDRDYLEQAIRDPNFHLSAGYEVWNAVLKSGEVVSGRLINREEASVTLLVQSPRSLLTLAHADIDVDADGTLQLHRSSSSAMPNGYGQLLTTQELDQLVTFLETLR